jgi:hypothetical protein
VLHCRLMDYLHHVAIWKEYACQRLAGIAPSVLAATRAPIHPRTAVSDGPPPPPHPDTGQRMAAQISAHAIRGPRVVIGSRPGWRVAIRATRAPSAGRPPRRG